MSDLTTRDVADISTRTLSLRAESVDEDTRSVEAVLATDRPVQVFDARAYEVIDEVLVADGARFAGQIPLLDNHSRGSVDDILGSIREIRVVEGSVVGRLYFDEDGPDGRAERAWNKVKRRHLTDVSVGYRVDEATEIRAGETGEVMGRKYEAHKKRGLRVASAWTIKEGSATPIGADEAAKIRSYQQSTTPTDGGHPVPAEQTDQTQAGSPAGAQDQQPQTRTVNTGAVELVAVELGGQTRTPDQITLAERTRISEIHRIGGPAEVIERAISEGWNVTRAKAEILDAERAAVPAPVPCPVNERAPDFYSFGNYAVDGDDKLRMISAGLATQARLGPEHVARKATRDQVKTTERAFEEAAKNRLSDLSFKDYLSECVEATTGRRAPRGVYAVMNEFNRLMRQQQILGRAATSTMDLANVFTDVVNAQLIKTFEEAPDTTAGWTSETDVPDFRQNERPRMTQIGNLERLQSGGIAEHKTRSDIVEKYNVRRYAAQCSWDEQDVINDRFNAFGEFPRRLALSAARLRPDLCYFILANGETAGLTSGALFSSGQNNLQASSALASATLRTGIELMMAQTEADDEGNSINLNIEPAYLITPVALKFTAYELLNSSAIVIGGDTGIGVRGSANVLMNAVTPVCDGRLDNGVKDPEGGTSSTADTAAWYLAANAAIHPVLEVGFVRQTGRVPRVRSYLFDKGQFGMGYDVSLDIGAKALSFLGIQKSND